MYQFSHLLSPPSIKQIRGSGLGNTWTGHRSHARPREEPSSGAEGADCWHCRRDTATETRGKQISLLPSGGPRELQALGRWWTDYWKLFPDQEKKVTGSSQHGFTKERGPNLTVSVTRWPVHWLWVSPKVRRIALRSQHFLLQHWVLGGISTNQAHPMPISSLHLYTKITR